MRIGDTAPSFDMFRMCVRLCVAWAIANCATARALERFTSGHADMAVFSSGTNLLLRYDFASTAIIDGSPVGGSGRVADPALIETITPNNSRILIPDDSAYSPYWRNRNVWYLPPNNVFGVPDLGLGNNVASGVFAGNSVTLYLDSIVNRPAGGEFMLINSEGTPVYMDTANPASTNQLVIPAHNHYYWAFSEAGTYRLNFRAEAVVQATSQLSSTIATFTFTVVPEPSTWTLAITSLAVACLAIRRKSMP